MNRFYTYSDAGEPAVRLNQHHPARPLAVVAFRDDRDFTSKDPAYCRRVAQAGNAAADLLEIAHQRTGETLHDPDRAAGQ